MNESLKDLWREQRLLILAGGAFVVLTIIFIALTALDPAQILGIDRWIKPLKFSSSIALYFLTLAVYLYYLPGGGRAKKIVAFAATFLMSGEMVLITMQAARGATSHFNDSTRFDDSVFTAMGWMILLNTILIVRLTVSYFRAPVDLPKAILWGMRMGLIVFVIASLQGGYMASQTGHAVCAADGGPGLPIVNWSTSAGDLRVAHFLGLHALQIIPLFSFAFVRLKKRISFIKPLSFTIIFAALYFLLFTFLFAQALSGNPVIKAPGSVGSPGSPGSSESQNPSSDS